MIVIECPTGFACAADEVVVQYAVRTIAGMTLTTNMPSKMLRRVSDRLIDGIVHVRVPEHVRRQLQASCRASG